MQLRFLQSEQVHNASHVAVGTVLFWVDSLVLAVGLDAYAFAHIFLVNESFVSLRHVPIGVYTAVPWANYIPHF